MLHFHYILGATCTITYEEVSIMARKQIVEEIVFDSYQDALDVKTTAEEKIENVEGAKILALIGTVCGAISIITLANPNLNFLMMVAFVISCVCYVKAKCFGGAFRWGLNLAKWGWYLCPFFPADLVVAAVCLFVGFFAFFLLPSLALRGVKKQAEEDLYYANEFLSTHQA